MPLAYSLHEGFFYQLFFFTCNHAHLLCGFLIKYEYEYEVIFRQKQHISGQNFAK